VGHAVHFLERLERLSSPQVDLALSLYRDPELVRTALRRATLPDGAERVALSLGDDERGPWLILERASGAFVTCLAEGMAHDLPVVRFAKLAATQSWLEELRAAGRVLPGAGLDLWKRLFAAGPALAREDMAVMVQVAPLLVEGLVQVQKDAIERYSRLLSSLLRAQEPGRRRAAEARECHLMAWTLGHLALLLGSAYRPRADTPAERKWLLALLMAPLATTGISGVMLRAALGTALTGRWLLADLKRSLSESSDDLGWMSSLLALTAVGLRSERVQAEAQKALRTLPAAIRDAWPDDQREAMVRSARGLVDALFDGSSEIAELSQSYGGRLAVRLTSHLPPGAAHRFERPEDVPADLARAAACNDPRFGLSGDPFLFLGSTLCAVARGRPEDLYLPADFLAATRLAESCEEHYRDVLQQLHDHYGPRDGPRAGPARNAPCACGSGRKYKRCCGAEGRG
jgi:hypothetical protein